MQEFDDKGLIIKEASSDLPLDRLLSMLKLLNKNETVIQIFNPNAVINRMHLLAAWANTSIAFRERTNRAKSPALEMLLFVSMSGQIGRAIKTAGAKSSSRFIVFSNSRTAFERLRAHLSSVRGFVPNMDHVSAVSRLYGIRWMKDVDKEIMQKMALSRLED